MNRILYFLFIVLFLTACCNQESVETHRYELSEIERQLIPYSFYETIPWEYSGGFEFDMTVNKCYEKWNAFFPYCEYDCCGVDYYSYQTKFVNLKANYLRLDVDIIIGDKSEDQESRMLLYRINNNRAELYYNEDGEFPEELNLNLHYFDSLSINGKMFYGVKEYPFLPEFFIENPNLHIKSILFNDYGLLQIKLSNDEHLSVNFTEVYDPTY